MTISKILSHSKFLASKYFLFSSIEEIIDHLLPLVLSCSALKSLKTSVNNILVFRSRELNWMHMEIVLLTQLDYMGRQIH